MQKTASGGQFSEDKQVSCSITFYERKEESAINYRDDILEENETRDRYGLDLPDESADCITVDARLLYSAFEFATLVAESPNETSIEKVTALAEDLADDLRDCLIAYEKAAIEQGHFPPYGESLLSNPNYFCYLDEPLDET